MSYKEEIAQMQREAQAEAKWRQEYQQEDWEGHVNGVAAEYNEAIRLRNEALAEGDGETAKYHDRAAVRLYTEYNELNPPPSPPPHPDEVELYQKNQPYLRKFGERGAKFVDKAHKFWAKRGVVPGHPDYKERMRDYADMYSRNAGVPYDRLEELPLPNEVPASANSPLSNEAYNNAAKTLANQGRFTRNR
jgi:hypothetical protein